MSKDYNAKPDAERRSRSAAAKVGGLAVLTATCAALVALLLLPSAAKGRQDRSAAPVAIDRIGQQWTRRLSRVVSDVHFSFELPSGWEQGPHTRTGDGKLLVTKSIAGPQGAEAVVFWTSFPIGGPANACTTLTESRVGPSAADLAGIVARAPGTTLVQGPSRVTIGGHAAHHVVLTVRKDVGCDPGFFYRWRPRAPHGKCLGACWLESNVGDTIRVWIVEVDGTRLFFEAETAKDGGHLRTEIRRIVASIRFH